MATVAAQPVALNGGTDEKVTTIPQPSEGRQSKVNGMVNGTNGVGQHLFHGARG
jgi:hypothetical protein